MCALTDDPFNPTYLSPGHFLIGEPLTQLNAVDFTDAKYIRLSRWQTYQHQLQQFWQRWSSDNIQTLQQRQRWLRTYSNMQPGYILLLREENTTPLHWPNAVITDINKGKDGKARVVTLRNHKGILNVSLNICPLPRANDEL
jgi:hypothetical protein